jgi:hypothetical protein
MRRKRGTLRPIAREFSNIQQDLASCNRRLKNRIDAINTLASIAFAADIQWQSPTFEDHHPGISFESDVLFK